jgi:hypothetical protein
MSYEKLVHHIRGSFFESLIAITLLTLAFIAFEPTVGRAVTPGPDVFTVTQAITDEISFETVAQDVVMSPSSIPGLTGGQATGSAWVVVSTNSVGGYTLDISFSTATAMTRNNSNGADKINNYSPAGTTSPTTNFVIGGAGTPGEFGYTVDASTTHTVAEEFRGNGTLCNIGPSGTESVDQCWQAPSVAAKEIINATNSTPVGGATTTVKFVVEIPSNPSPTIPTGTYVATVTLTATAQ